MSVLAETVEEANSGGLGSDREELEQVGLGYDLATPESSTVPSFLAS